MCIWAVQRTWYCAAPHYGKTSPSNFLVSCIPAAGPSVMPDPQTKPAPWQLTGQCYLLFKYTTGGAVHAQRRPSEGCPSHQSIIDSDPVSPFVGGVGGILFVRYDTSPVGPYSELLFVPGSYATQPLSPLRGHSSSAFRVSQVFVSSSASVMSGRENWGVPKRKADFTWQHGPQRGVVQLSVRLSVRLSASLGTVFLETCADVGPVQLAVQHKAPARTVHDNRAAAPVGSSPAAPF